MAPEIHTPAQPAGWRKKLYQTFRREVLKSRRRLRLAVRSAALLHRLGVWAIARSRLLILPIYYDYDDVAGNPDFVSTQWSLQSRIAAILERYRRDPDVYKYFFGHPYQGLGIANVFGDRISDYRFDEYELRKLVKPEDRVLDIGCNCGFVAVVTSYRIGCRSHGLDINPYMIEIGQVTARHLKIEHLVELQCGRIQEFTPAEPFDVVLSFATHWTDDNNYRVGIEEHMQRMSSYLRPGGRLVFETHCNDVGNQEFHAALENCRRLFDFDGMYKTTDNGTRELYVMTRR